MTAQQTIDLTAGAIEYTWPLTLIETTGKDITADTIQLSLGGYEAPATWQAPDTDTAPVVSQRVVQLLVGDTLTPAPGAYWLWSQIVDNPEIVPRRHQRITIT